MKKRALISIAIVLVLILAYFIWSKFASERINLQNLQSPCKIVKTCGDLVGVDCNSAVDGSYYFVNKNSGKIIEYCGGFCMGSSGIPNGKYCRNCPPKEWTCEGY